MLSRKVILIYHNSKNSLDILTTVPYSLLPLTCSLLPTDSISDSRFPIPDSRFTINPMFTTQIQTL
ncbi:hypothetical protein [Moorena sp. SIO4G3]|uniref:hypothetical protein n=1 Tax=Moorena sp. SIO4G3 TaxID=2607821 RepID=UPI0014291D7A|nr:hypothetical protein [Moorena sp. SIO4G3]NEO81891.1 hypothetical protein [Moorena sp. SIO4G3]